MVDHNVVSKINMERMKRAYEDIRNDGKRDSLSVGSGKGEK